LLTVSRYQFPYLYPKFARYHLQIVEVERDLAGHPAADVGLFQPCSPG
jgi:hypothetical protein